jgi:MarR family transcriptional regulator for hemolysin
VPAPAGPPIGLHVARTAKALNRAFDDTLAAVDGSLPRWLIVLSLKTRRVETQRELADAVGIRGATLTHHLDAMEAGGLVTRRRDPDHRRVQKVALTASGEAAFDRMRTAAMAFDRRLRTDITAADLAVCVRVLDALRANVLAPSSPS